MKKVIINMAKIIVFITIINLFCIAILKFLIRIDFNLENFNLQTFFIMFCCSVISLLIVFYYDYKHDRVMFKTKNVDRK